MKLSVIIINYNTPEMTEKTIRAFNSHMAGFDYEIILIDNASNNKLTAEIINDLNLAYLENQKNIGFAPAVNQGLVIAKGEYVLLLNSDVIIKDESIREMITFMDTKQNVAVLGPKMSYPNGKVQASAGWFPTIRKEIWRFSMLNKVLPCGTLIYETGFNRVFFKTPQAVDWVSGGCMLIRTSALKELGLFDGNYFFGIEDWDFCHRAKANGWQVVYFPIAEVIHYHGFSSGGRRSTKSLKMEKDGVKYFLKKFYKDKNLSNKAIIAMYDLKIFILKTMGF
jgi:GT2 family glycosyltransferase